MSSSKNNKQLISAFGHGFKQGLAELFQIFFDNTQPAPAPDRNGASSGAPTQNNAPTSAQPPSSSSPSIGPSGASSGAPTPNNVPTSAQPPPMSSPPTNDERVPSASPSTDQFMDDNRAQNTPPTPPAGNAPTGAGAADSTGRGQCLSRDIIIAMQTRLLQLGVPDNIIMRYGNGLRQIIEERYGNDIGGVMNTVCERVVELLAGAKVSKLIANGQPVAADVNKLIGIVYQQLIDSGNTNNYDEIQPFNEFTNALALGGNVGTVFDDNTTAKAQTVQSAGETLVNTVSSVIGDTINSVMSSERLNQLVNAVVDYGGGYFENLQMTMYGLIVMVTIGVLFRYYGWCNPFAQKAPVPAPQPVRRAEATPAIPIDNLPEPTLGNNVVRATTQGGGSVERPLEYYVDLLKRSQATTISSKVDT